MKNIFNKHRKLISNAYCPSVFTKDDVLFLINRIEQDLLDVEPNNEKMLEVIKEKVLEVVENFDYDSYVDLEVYNREITIEFNTETLVNRIEVVFEKSGV